MQVDESRQALALATRLERDAAAVLVRLSHVRPLRLRCADRLAHACVMATACVDLGDHSAGAVEGAGLASPCLAHPLACAQRLCAKAELYRLAYGTFSIFSVADFPNEADQRDRERKARTGALPGCCVDSQPTQRASVAPALSLPAKFDWPSEGAAAGANGGPGRLLHLARVALRRLAGDRLAPGSIATVASQLDALRSVLTALAAQEVPAWLSNHTFVFRPNAVLQPAREYTAFTGREPNAADPAGEEAETAGGAAALERMAVVAQASSIVNELCRWVAGVCRTRAFVSAADGVQRARLGSAGRRCSRRTDAARSRLPGHVASSGPFPLRIFQCKWFAHRTAAAGHLRASDCVYAARAGDALEADAVAQIVGESWSLKPPRWQCWTRQSGSRTACARRPLLRVLCARPRPVARRCARRPAFERTAAARSRSAL